MRLGTIIGLPVAAAIHAQIESTTAVFDYLYKIGAVGDSAENDIQYIAFNYQKIKEDGNIEKVQIQVPLLTLISLPYMHIKSMSLKFFVRISRLPHPQNENTLSSLDPPQSADEKGKLSVYSDYAKHDIDRWYSGFVSPNNNNGQLNRHMEVSLDITRDDTPYGMLQLLNTLNSFTITKKVQE